MLEVQNIHKTYEGQPLLRGISFSVAEGETVCLLGASGSGKSTLLRIVAGLEAAESGRILWGGADISAMAAHRRNFGLMFQDYGLFPHLSVAENVAFGLKMKKLPAREIWERVAAVLGMVNMQGFEHRRVTDLSGGEQQRVALARALAPRPRLMMFDEPLGALDRALRDRLLGELRGILHRTRVPAIYVTHDQEEAFTIADRIILLHDGEIVQQGAPEAVYAHPKSAWVARFLGLGNVVEGHRLKVEGQRSRDDTQYSILDARSSNIEYQISQVETPFGVWEISCKTGAGHGESAALLVRPGAVSFGGGGNRVSGRVADVVFEKERYRIVLENGFYFYAEKPMEVGANVDVRVEAECLM